MKKRFFALLLVFAVLLTFAACGKDEAPDQGEEPKEPETKPAASDLDEILLTEDENLTVKVTAIDEDGFWGYTLHVYIENKTDKALMVGMDDVSVNGYMCDPLWGEEVSAGTSVTSEVTFFREELENSGIETVTEILFVLSASDYEDLFADPILKKDCAIYPLGEDAAQHQERQPQESDIVLFDNDSATMTVTGLDPNGEWGYTVEVYLENKTDATLNFSVDDAAVNGYIVDPFWAAEVAGGKKAVSEFTFTESELETIGAETVTDITFTASLSDPDDWFSDPVYVQACALYPMGEAAAVRQERESQPTDIVVFDNQYAKMIVIGEKTDLLFDYGLQVYLENKTDKTLTFSLEDTMVNGFGCDPFWAADVAPGLRRITIIGWFESDLSEFAITQVESVTAKVIVSDADDWSADPLVEKNMKVNP